MTRKSNPALKRRFGSGFVMQRGKALRRCYYGRVRMFRCNGKWVLDILEVQAEKGAPIVGFQPSVVDVKDPSGDSIGNYVEMRRIAIVPELEEGSKK